MKTTPKALHLAVLIDADNAPASVIEGILEETARLGTATVRRIYGDWTSPHLGGWKKVLLKHSIQPIQQFAYTSGKNATDSALIIDADSTGKRQKPAIGANERRAAPMVF